MTALSIRREFKEIVPQVLRRERRPAKVIAFKIEATKKSVENWTAANNGPSVPYFFALAREIPELRAVALRWLDADNANGDPVRAADELVKMLNAMQR